MQLVYSTMVLCSIHFPLPHWHLIPMLCMQRSPMQYISSHNTPSSTTLIPWTTHDMKKSMIDSSVALTNGPLFLRVVLCGELQYSLLFPTDLELLVTQGPSEDTFSWGHTMELDRKWLFDDTLWDNEKDLIWGVYELEASTLPSFQLINLLTVFKAMVIKWNACCGGHANPFFSTQACGLGIGPHIVKPGSNITWWRFVNTVLNYGIW